MGGMVGVMEVLIRVVVFIMLWGQEGMEVVQGD